MSLTNREMIFVSKKNKKKWMFSTLDLQIFLYTYFHGHPSN